MNKKKLISLITSLFSLCVLNRSSNIKATDMVCWEDDVFDGYGNLNAYSSYCDDVNNETKVSSNLTDVFSLMMANPIESGGSCIILFNLLNKAINTNQINTNHDDLIKKISSFIDGYCNDKNECTYDYNEWATILNYFCDFRCDPRERIFYNTKRFMETKKGTCWELSMMVDFYLSDEKVKTAKNIKSHHIVAFRTTPITAHTFNIYTTNNNELHIIDVYNKINDTYLQSYKAFEESAKKINGRLGYNAENCKNWLVMSEISDSLLERMKSIGFKKWARFSNYEDFAEGTFVKISNDQLQLNSPENIEWNQSPPCFNFG